MTAKTDLPSVPPALADVAMIDGPTCAAAAGISISSWQELVRMGAAPAPVIRQPRCTRWRMADVRAWLIERAAKPAHDPRVLAQAKRATAKARAKRQTAAAGA